MIYEIKIATYRFDDDANPFEHSRQTQDDTLSKIAQQISSAIEQVRSSSDDDLLVRGVQSAKHERTKKQLLAKILAGGRDYEDPDEPDTIYAAPYEGDDDILKILEGFHVFKPKCEERPQHPVDIWLIYSTKAYQNIEYLHPRHNVLAHDKWQRIDPTNSGLIAIITIANERK